MARVFQDDRGNNSSMRVVWMISVLTVLFVWAFVCIEGKKLVPMDLEHVLGLAALLGAKVGQKALEKKKEES